MAEEKTKIATETEVAIQVPNEKEEVVGELPNEEPDQPEQKEPDEEKGSQAVAEAEDNEEIEDEEEEEEQLSPQQIEILAMVDKRCWIMEQCLAGSVNVIVDTIENDLMTDEISKYDMSNFSQFGPLPPDITKMGILSTAAMLASKVYDSIVPGLKPRDSKSL